ncbi:MAG: DUF4147 domain-containing protein [Clostridia bacterium]|nr:DUF4147 domain-containing protein [Clostridia bacterium]
MKITPYIQNTNGPLSQMQEDALAIFGAAVTKCNPFDSTCKALLETDAEKIRFVLSIGKAAVPMMQAAYHVFGAKNIREAVLVTKYDHLDGFHADNCICFEAGHPISDENSVKAAEYVLERTANLSAEDVCIVLISGGGSALFETSLIDAQKQREITDILLKSGADIYEINCVRKRLSAVKGGRLAAHMHPAKVLTFALSDVPGSRPDVIASGPTQADRFPDEEFYRIVDRYHLNIDGVLNNIPPKAELPEDTHFRVVGDMRMLCLYAGKEAENRGYTFHPLQDMLNDDAEVVAGGTIRSALSFTEHCIGKRAYICGGEPSVCVRGKGKGGRSQQAALRAALELDGIKNVVFLAGGSDGTDGPTDAAGGIVDGRTAAKMRRNGIDAELYLANNNAYPALQSSGALLMTGPTGTNVNDLFILLIEKEIPCNP